MMIHLKLFGTLRNLAKQEQKVSLCENSIVNDLIDLLVEKHGAEFEERLSRQEMWQITINGHPKSLTSALNSKLEEGDEVVILPMICGG